MGIFGTIGKGVKKIGKTTAAKYEQYQEYSSKIQKTRHQQRLEEIKRLKTESTYLRSKAAVEKEKQKLRALRPNTGLFGGGGFGGGYDFVTGEPIKKSMPKPKAKPKARKSKKRKSKSRGKTITIKL